MKTKLRLIKNKLFFIYLYVKHSLKNSVSKGIFKLKYAINKKAHNKFNLINNRKHSIKARLKPK